MSASARTVVRFGFVVAVLTTFAAVGCGGESDTAADATTDTATTAETQPTTTTDATTTNDEVTQTPTLVRISVVNGAPKGGIARETTERGDRVVVIVNSDVADEVHLHGYDISRPVAAGATVRLPFRATIPGRFEVELEERGVPIGELTVQP